MSRRDAYWRQALVGMVGDCHGVRYVARCGVRSLASRREHASTADREHAREVGSAFRQMDGLLKGVLKNARNRTLACNRPILARDRGDFCRHWLRFRMCCRDSRSGHMGIVGQMTTIVGAAFLAFCGFCGLLLDGHHAPEVCVAIGFLLLAAAEVAAVHQ